RFMPNMIPTTIDNWQPSAATPVDIADASRARRHPPRGDQHRPLAGLTKDEVYRERDRPAIQLPLLGRPAGLPSAEWDEGRQGTSPSPQRTKSATVTAAAVTPVSVI